ncbi:hypothetical protein BABINDRAFT_164294 [Babjeviella inositovora NRRL Y-12698]|uniref:Uncharacterized protein n=1 Tax=Babjeviella inositovora NRRL Y-12698 TaxID=984486 RepID=A0A1E3QXY0_9ASCO|nr:uncharacterized protein BABINDRAFT_164294 [Babjeviella inositovora NRRL Y-12698]ODQ82515.1 hypothetical protein BABINDRAFT_164294 [Babjeviella inositovora NRRL Y-12698]
MEAIVAVCREIRVISQALDQTPVAIHIIDELVPKILRGINSVEGEAGPLLLAITPCFDQIEGHSALSKNLFCPGINLLEVLVKVLCRCPPSTRLWYILFKLDLSVEEARSSHSALHRVLSSLLELAFSGNVPWKVVKLACLLIRANQTLFENGFFPEFSTSVSEYLPRILQAINCLRTSFVAKNYLLELQTKLIIVSHQRLDSCSGYLVANGGTRPAYNYLSQSLQRQKDPHYLLSFWSIDSVHGTTATSNLKSFGDTIACFEHTHLILMTIKEGRNEISHSLEFVLENLEEVEVADTRNFRLRFSATADIMADGYYSLFSDTIPPQQTVEVNFTLKKHHEDRQLEFLSCLKQPSLVKVGGATSTEGCTALDAEEGNLVVPENGPSMFSHHENLRAEEALTLDASLGAIRGDTGEGRVRMSVSIELIAIKSTSDLEDSSDCGETIGVRVVVSKEFSASKPSRDSLFVGFNPALSQVMEPEINTFGAGRNILNAVNGSNARAASPDFDESTRIDVLDSTIYDVPGDNTTTRTTIEECGQTCLARSEADTPIRHHTLDSVLRDRKRQHPCKVSVVLDPIDLSTNRKTNGGGRTGMVPSALLSGTSSSPTEHATKRVQGRKRLREKTISPSLDWIRAPSLELSPKIPTIPEVAVTRGPQGAQWDRRGHVTFGSEIGDSQLLPSLIQVAAPLPLYASKDNTLVVCGGSQGIPGKEQEAELVGIANGMYQCFRNDLGAVAGGVIEKLQSLEMLILARQAEIEKEMASRLDNLAKYQDDQMTRFKEYTDSIASNIHFPGTQG